MRNNRDRMFVMCIRLLVPFVVILMMATETPAQPLKQGFYKTSCPSAERVVRDVVRSKLTANPSLAAGLIRLSFHDCFVRGCDASILLSQTGNNVSEQEAPANVGTLRGFEVIDDAKAKLEKACPKTVSCADILHFAARDGANIVGGISYNLPGGRRDGVISLVNDVKLPGPSSDVNTLTNIFSQKGLSVREMVALLGAHSIGIGGCQLFSSRLYNFNRTDPGETQDPSLDPAYAAFLKTQCPKNGQGGAGFANLDPITPNRLDNQFYRNVNRHRVLFTSDQLLLASPETSRIVRQYMNNGTLWAEDFGAAMVHMNSIGVLTGKQGEIRLTCGIKNKN